MWIRSIFGLFIGAYAGGVVASYGMLIWLDIRLSDPTLGVYPVYFGAAVMFFTLPGAIMVAGIFNELTHKGFRRSAAYALAGAVGTLIGGIILAILFADWRSMVIGGLYGASTSACWAAVDALLRAVARAKSTMDLADDFNLTDLR